MCCDNLLFPSKAGLKDLDNMIVVFFLKLKTFDCSIPGTFQKGE